MEVGVERWMLLFRGRSGYSLLELDLAYVD